MTPEDRLDLAIETANLIDGLRAENEQLKETLRSRGANRYWEGRWRDEFAENERLRTVISRGVDLFEFAEDEAEIAWLASARTALGEQANAGAKQEST
jgi:hypothetical protein